MRVLDTFFAELSNDEVDGARTAFAAPPVDLARLHEAMGDDPEEFSEMLEVYLSQMSENLEKLETAVLEQNFHEVELIAHNCCGTSANCGVTAVVAPLRELETAGRENNLTGANKLLTEIKLSFERIREFLNDQSLQPA
jgi:two-component system sensor histidine kinase/response regulator